MQSPLALLASLPPNTRVVIRRRVDHGFTDSLGELVALGDATCTVRTRKGDDVVLLTDITAAKQIPPPPARRGPRAPG